MARRYLYVVTLNLADLDTLKEAAIRKFEAGLSREPGQHALDRQIGQLQAELEQIYRMVVLLQRNEPSTERVGEIWGKTVAICDEFARRLSTLAATQPVYRAAYDRILDFRNAADERCRLHSRE
jgi:hypothetical protein